MNGTEKKRGVIRIIGIDPGYAIVGYGVIDYDGYEFRALDYGCIRTPAGTSFEKRLALIWDELSILMRRYAPDAMAVEKLFFQNNQKTAIDVAQARGVVLLCAEKHDAELFEYTPLQVKSAVVGYGKAEKKQVQAMTKSILRLAEIPKPDDTADALAIAVCHGHCAGAGANYKKLLNMR